jgi:hypothetical protein
MATDQTFGAVYIQLITRILFKFFPFITLETYRSCVHSHYVCRNPHETLRLVRQILSLFPNTILMLLFLFLDT